ncbi:MAG: hypothetical protein COB66_04195 [Coxiella sp. (in: Bacteria)]|nr:MAG: hypothetical protein COB66_04195 [Coxiella sp. (in: g-proteobacteria)]
MLGRIMMVLGCCMPMLALAATSPLRVCTTGDYPPLTSYQNGKFTGSAIESAKELGRYLNQSVVFVRTTWPTLNYDVAMGHCDIAMGGISWSKQRAAKFLLSHPVSRFGKVPLIRINDKQRFHSLHDIDRHGIRVVENKGGTNEAFARIRLTKARLIIVPKNQMAFDYLLKNKADVMFTDNIEAIYRARIMPGLYVVNPNKLLTQNANVYMLPKNKPRLLNAVNAWIRKEKHTRSHTYVSYALNHVAARNGRA